ncbi:MAG: phospholipase D family protein [Tannerella sp.]|jgi:HKD family nuclease|nr:phospholipase D family protein [Tannerella sp.]
MVTAKLLKSPFEYEFRAALNKAEKEIIFSSPYINDAGASVLIESIRNPDNKRIRILTNLSVSNIIDNVTQPAALLKICASFSNIVISSLERLHAKVYIIDVSFAVITSANLTNGGLRSNFEYGVAIDDPETIKTIKRDILDYASLGHVFDRDFLVKIYGESKKIEKVQTKNDTQRNSSDLKSLLASQKKLDTIFALRYEDTKTRHSIFTKTVLFLLEKHKQLTTQELYVLVQGIHPEMCDDNIIYHNEKRWKIEIRQALFYWRRKDIVIGQGTSRNNTWILKR